MGEQDRGRRFAAVVVTAEGRRVPVQLPPAGLVDVSLPGILRLIGLGILALIGGSRREPEGKRRDDR
ncbi:MAG: hypothetical protein A2X23_04555 [Chloroflexi bacterium GWC2_73_18]|nr:MAG: hypothetical protein A2X23_04555 [Chloroflexi bacterium GWC2_73_18]